AGAVLPANVQLTTVAVEGPPIPSPTQRAEAGREVVEIVFLVKRQLFTVAVESREIASAPPKEAEFASNVQPVTVARPELIHRAPPSRPVVSPTKPHA